jgi:DNA-binding CsgD family transcriptional regulator
LNKLMQSLNNPGGDHLLVKKWISLILLVWFLGGEANAWAGSKTTIQGYINLDTTVWAETAYLSLIPEMRQLSTISLDQIIGQAKIDNQGYFNFQLDLLGDMDQIYRIHFVKKGDPPASLIIGGRDQNHFFLLSGNGTETIVRIPSGRNLLEGLSFEGYSPNLSLLKADKLISELNALDEQATTVNRNYIRGVFNRQLREMADTSSHILVSLYALWHSDYREHQAVDPGWYTAYMKRWKNVDSSYLSDLRLELGLDRKGNSLGILVVLLLAVSVILLLIIWSRKVGMKVVPSGPDLSQLTVQERKVYALLREGYSNKEIAGDLVVSISTVKTHVNNIFSKLGVNSRKEILDHIVDESFANISGTSLY